MGIVDGAKRFFKTESRPDQPEKFTKIESLEQAANYVQAIKDEAKKGSKIDVTITTATSPERRAFLNYAISLLPDSLSKYKILLFMRVNPIKTSISGRETYLSKREIAKQLSRWVGRLIPEEEIDREEQKGIRYCFQAIASCREKNIPILEGKV